MSKRPRFFEADGTEVVLPPRPVEGLEHICELGGQFDEASVTLFVFSETLDRERVTEQLGVQPTKAWNPGERHPIGSGASGRTRIVDWGKWWLSTGRGPGSVEPKLRGLLGRCTSDFEVWRALVATHEVWVTVSGHLDNWNRELDLSPSVLSMLADRHLPLRIDVYFDGDGGDAGAP